MAENYDECPFCEIAKANPPAEGYVPLEHDYEASSPTCHLLLSTPKLLAFLDIMPIAEGHVLVINRKHRGKISDLRGNEGAAFGSWLPVISRALMKALGKPEGDWNVLQNNGTQAAQTVPHIHYHIIPRIHLPGVQSKSWTMFGRGQRQDLDDEEAVVLAKSIKEALVKELEDMKVNDVEARALLGKL